MKIIQLYTLLGMIKTGTQPYTIRFHSCNWKWDNECKDYYNIHYKKLFDGVLSGNLTSSLNDIVEILDDRVELLEEPKGIPEKLSTWYSVEENQSIEENCEFANCNFETMYEKINEIIDYLESKGE